MNTKNLMNLLVIWSGVLAFTTIAQAAPITYTVNRTNGTGSLTGTITTDGTIGTLTALNFVSSNLTTSMGANSFSLIGLTYSASGPAVPGAFIRTEVVGSGLTATSTQLLFDFGLSGSTFFVVNTQGSPNPIYCATSGFAECAGNERFGQTGDPQVLSASGNVVLGTFTPAPPDSGIPEPTTSALLLTGLTALCWIQRRSRKA